MSNKEVREMLKFFSLVGPGDEGDDGDGCEHDDYGEESGPDSPPNDDG